MYLRVVSHWSDPASVVRDGVDAPVLAASPDRWPTLGDPTEQMMAVDFLTYLPDDILTKVDRATMAVGLEGRVPFLDRRIVEFAARLPHAMRSGDGVSKRVIRDVLYSRVPAELLNRPKTGFGIPLDSWLRAPLRSWGEELLSDPLADRYLQIGPIRQLWDDHQSGRHDHGYRLWDVLTFLAWADARRLG
jgi:asparagine synthase (glutamine-hydrolysing)